MNSNSNKNVNLLQKNSHDKNMKKENENNVNNQNNSSIDGATHTRFSTVNCNSLLSRSTNKMLNSETNSCQNIKYQTVLNDSCLKDQFNIGTSEHEKKNEEYQNMKNKHEMSNNHCITDIFNNVQSIQETKQEFAPTKKKEENKFVTTSQNQDTHSKYTYNEQTNKFPEKNYQSHDKLSNEASNKIMFQDKQYFEILNQKKENEINNCNFEEKKKNYKNNYEKICIEREIKKEEKLLEKKHQEREIQKQCIQKASYQEIVLQEKGYQQNSFKEIRPQEKQLQEFNRANLKKYDEFKECELQHLQEVHNYDKVSKNSNKNIKQQLGIDLLSVFESFVREAKNQLDD